MSRCSTLLVAASAVISVSNALPSARPALRPPPLPVKLAGGLFLFRTAVPTPSQQLAADLQDLAQRALRSDPRVTMELGMGIEAGGIFASSASDDGLVINYQINGGNSWAEATAYGVVGSDGLELVDLSVANMDAAMLGEVSLEVAPVGMASPLRANEAKPSRMAEAMDAARTEAMNSTSTMQGRVVPTSAAREMQGRAVPTARSGVPKMHLGRRVAASRPRVLLPRSAPPAMMLGTAVDLAAPEGVESLGALQEAYGHLDASTALLLADENGKWLSDSFDAAAALAIPFILAGLLFAFFKLLKLFASAF